MEKITFYKDRNDLADISGVEFFYKGHIWVAYYSQNDELSVIRKELVYSTNIRDNDVHARVDGLTLSELEKLVDAQENESNYFCQVDEDSHIIAGTIVGILDTDGNVINTGIVGYNTKHELCIFVENIGDTDVWKSYTLESVKYKYKKLKDSPLEPLIKNVSEQEKKWQTSSNTDWYKTYVSKNSSIIIPNSSGNITTTLDTVDYTYSNDSEDDDYPTDEEYKLEKIKLLVDNFDDDQEDALTILSIIGDIIG